MYILNQRLINHNSKILQCLSLMHVGGGGLKDIFNFQKINVSPQDDIYNDINPQTCKYTVKTTALVYIRIIYFYKELKSLYRPE